MSRYARKKDNNHNDIVAWALEIGFMARDTSRLGDGFPDSVMAFRVYREFWVNDLWEIKDGKKGTLTEDEREFFDSWPGPKVVIRTFDDVTARRDYWLKFGEAVAQSEPLRQLLISQERSYAEIAKTVGGVA